MSAQRALVALMSPPYSTLTYSLPEYFPAGYFRVGLRVAVPLGKGLRAGLITGFVQALPAGEESFVVKPLAWPLELTPLLTERYIDLLSQLALRQIEPIGRILGNVLPAGLRSTVVRIRLFGEGKPRELRIKDLLLMSEQERLLAAALWAEGRADVCRTGVSPLDAEICVLSKDPPWPVRPAARAQSAVLEYLFQHGAVSRRKLLDALGKGAATPLAALTGRGLVSIQPYDLVEDDSPAANSPPVAPSSSLEGHFTLTPEQQNIYDTVVRAMGQGEAGPRLLYGITGSGKTAVYLELARHVLDRGKSVLLLAPEVALAIKLWNDAKAAFGEQLCAPAERLLFHGYQSAGAKERAFVDLGGAQDVPRVVVGTRSALLLPLDNIGLIVLDEEHDASFKQDEGMSYQAKEVAWYRAGLCGATLLMGSATPDLKSFHAAREGHIPMHTLSARVGGGDLPEVTLVTMPKGRAGAGEGSAESLLAQESLEALRETVDKGEQAVILLNRRGYAPLMYCLGCNTVARCPHCDISLAYHKGRERLVCHYCGHSVPYPSPCTACGSVSFLPMGEGTEKMEESLAPLLPPGTGILRLDKDSARRPGRMEEILAAFARKEAAVLIGTQMLSKGHHFPDVTLAIVADADLGLNLPDYRAAEKTFQLLVQSSGRSGRGEKPGRVLIQTRDPAHYCWQYVRRADYEGFFEQELALRKLRHYPPFVRLALLRITCPIETQSGQEELGGIGKIMRQKARELGVTLLGPAPAPLHVLKGKRRWHCLAKAQEWPVLRELYAAAALACKGTHLSLTLDLDPVNML